MINQVGSLFGNPNATDGFEFEYKGYGGVILKFFVKGILDDDLIYSIGLLIMLGQVFSLIILYLKRVFYCILLGMIAPLVVAVDTIQKVVTGKDTGVLKNWFQNITAIIFNQSFQAIFMCFSIIVIGKFEELKFESQNVAGRDLIEALLAIISVHAIMKFDKLFKEILGVKDSKIMGGISENAMRSFAAIKSGLALAQRSSEPFKKRSQAKLRFNEAKNKYESALKKYKALGQSDNSGNGNNDDSNNSTDNQGNKSSNIGIADGNSDGISQIISSLDRIEQSINRNGSQGGGSSDKIADKREKLLDEMAGAEEEMKKARADQRAESLRAFTRFGTTVGALGFGVGATDNFGDAITVGNIVDVPMDKISDRAVDRGVYGNALRRLEGKEQAFIDKYTRAGLSPEDAKKLAEKSMNNIQSQLNNAIPENLGDMVADITRETVRGVGDVVNKEGIKHARKVAKKIYNAGNIDEI